MADLSSDLAIAPLTIKATSAAQARGVRVTLASTGDTAVTDATTRGDYVTLQAIAASDYGAAASLGGGGKVPALASEAVAIGDPAYAAASGKFSKTSTNAAYLGRWTQAASGDGVLGQVLLESVA